jgi:hypothetical protein
MLTTQIEETGMNTSKWSLSVLGVALALGLLVAPPAMADYCEELGKRIDECKCRYYEGCGVSEDSTPACADIQTEYFINCVIGREEAPPPPPPSPEPPYNPCDYITDPCSPEWVICGMG